MEPQPHLNIISDTKDIDDIVELCPSHVYVSRDHLEATINGERLDSCTFGRALNLCGWTLRSKGSVVAFCTFRQFIDDAFEVAYIYVDPNFRDLGYTKLLLEACYKHALTSCELNDIEIYVEALSSIGTKEDQETVEEFWRHCGFKYDRTYNNAVIYKKILTRHPVIPILDSK